MKKKIWRKNFSVKNINYQLITSAIADLIEYQSKTVGRKIIKEFVCIQKDYDNIGSYAPADQLREMVEETIKVIKNNPKLIKKVHDKTTKYNKEYFNYAKKISRTKLAELSNKQLSDVYKKLNYYQKITHGYAICTTWFVDSDGEDFSKLLISTTKDQIKKANSNLNFAEIFSVLTTPTKPSFAMKEENESLKLLSEIEKDKEIKKIFLQKEIKKIKEDIKASNNKIARKIIGHYKKWQWTPYMYIGPAYNLDFYLENWSSLLRGKVNTKKHINMFLNYQKEIEQKKQEIIKKLKIDNKTKKLFDIASEIIYLKSFRKDCMFHGAYVLDKILKEIASRLNLSLKQVRFMASWEIIPALKKESFSADILNERIKFSVLYQKDEKGKIYSGESAKKFLLKLNFEKEKKIKSDYLIGTCACPGKVVGKVKIINLSEEMDKMNKGDVMVAHTTFPSLVPAMKKASAIITDDGGITCHAAIVARELKTPTIVGTKIATEILKDGDKVEVDAERGIIKKIK